MATFNHASFVAQAIDSVLSQVGVDFEFLIADDGSTDSTRDVVASIQDPRIRFWPNEINRGACVVTNELIDRASGEFIALINSDDYWISNSKLACQLEILRKRPSVGACFGRARFVDKNGSIIEKNTLTNGRVFEQENRSRGAWLRHLFDLGNCICHPTMLIRKACYGELGVYDNRFRQLPDFDMWIRLLKRHDIFVVDEELIAFRNLPGENASSATTQNLRRLLNESYFILEKFFDGLSFDVFIDGFGDLLVNAEISNSVRFDIEHTLLYLTKNRWASHVYNKIGIEKLNFLLGSNIHRQILIKDYGIDDRVFHSMTAEFCTFDLDSPTDKLSTMGGLYLIAEVKRRVVARAPSSLRPILKYLFAKY